eukprot:TRINITY_DN3031_c0_g1_i3.p1 TRINITY_DN3031_c0_g1~~TRINITY_DN3031_c0_g1_i3.p1  ORF type:complete len:111 (+),score=20.89 TRINITY_DN3031_c0_g1_i3:469-801(+)
MEFAEGGDLLGKIKNHTRCRSSFSEDEVVKMFVQMVAGLKALHDRKILHRDIKVCVGGSVVREYIPDEEQRREARCPERVQSSQTRTPLHPDWNSLLCVTRSVAGQAVWC